MVHGLTVHDPAIFTAGLLVLGIMAMTAAVLPLRSVFRTNAAQVMRGD